VPKLYPEALLYCVLWMALAVAGALLFDWRVGIALSVGLFLIIMPTSALILSRTSNFNLERGVRWAILGLSGIAVAIAAA
jgi:hypothetical protein